MVAKSGDQLLDEDALQSRAARAGAARRRGHAQPHGGRSAHGAHGQHASTTPATPRRRSWIWAPRRPSSRAATSTSETSSTCCLTAPTFTEFRASAPAHASHARHGLHVCRVAGRQPRARPRPGRRRRADDRTTSPARSRTAWRSARATGRWTTSGTVIGSSKSGVIYFPDADGRRFARDRRDAVAGRADRERGRIVRRADRRGRRASWASSAENLGRRVTSLDYEAYEPLAVKAFGRIAEEIASSCARRRSSACTTGSGAWTSARPASPSSRLGAPGRRVCRVPVRHRTREADRADLEARALRRRRRLDRRRHRRIRTTTRGAAGSAEAGMRVTVRLFARLRDIAGAERARTRGPGRQHAGATCGRRCRHDFPAMAPFRRAVSGALNADTRAWTRPCRRRRGRVSAPGLRRVKPERRP